MSTGTVFENNRTQAVRLPADTRFPKGIKHVSVRVVGYERIISPVDRAWDSFFFTENKITDDFLEKRDQLAPQDREPL